MIGILVKPGEQPELVELDGSLEQAQELVGGYLEEIKTEFENVIMLLDEDGKQKNLAPNFTIPHTYTLGNVLFIGTKGAEFTSLTTNQAIIILDLLT